MKTTTFRARLVFSPRYDIRFLGLESMHPFDTRRAGRVWELLSIEFGDLGPWIAAEPGLAGDTDLLRVHDETYLRALRSSRRLAQALEFAPAVLIPAVVLQRMVVRPMRRATRGTVLAAFEALEHGIGINLAGGFHHASRSRGEGFCLFADVPLAIESLFHEGRLDRGRDRAAIIDLDAHQGNGNSRIYHRRPDVPIYDLYNRDVYPDDAWARRGIAREVAVGMGCGDEEYLGALHATLGSFLDDAAPRVVFYNAGTDVLAGDPLGGLALSREAVLERDRLVFAALRGRSIPFVFVPSGGYSPASAALIARSLSGLLKTGR